MTHRMSTALKASVVDVFEAVVVRSMREETSEADKSELYLRTC